MFLIFQEHLMFLIFSGAMNVFNFFGSNECFFLKISGAMNVFNFFRAMNVFNFFRSNEGF